MIIGIIGPTGVGKTKMSIELAKKYKAIIINADAMQVYKDLNIGTAKIKEEEKEGIEHYLFDIKEVEDDYTVYDYQKDARYLLDKYKNRNIIFVGGTGLYLKAALYNYEFKEESNNTNYDDLTNEELYELAKKKDPNMDIHLNNRKRLIRFLNREGSSNKGNEIVYPHILIGLTTNRDNLYKIINDRVDKMINEGLIDEVKYFYDKGISSKSINTGIGYKELYKYFSNEISLEEAIDLIKKNSRRYAKRQYTFFNNQLKPKWFDVDYDDFNKTINEVIDYIEGVKNDNS